MLYGSGSAGDADAPKDLRWDQDLLREALRMLYQNILHESRPAILAKSKVWCQPLLLN